MTMTMEDKYYASLRQRDDFDDFSFAPNQRYEQSPPRLYDQQQPRYDQQQCYNGGRIVDPVEQLQLLLQAVPVANAAVPPTIVYQAPPAMAQVHQAPLPAPNVQQLNLGSAANNANAANANAAPP
jgi:hypothetical protein